jgi:2-hydroxychromene-2-carboxylate isomerase
MTDPAFERYFDVISPFAYLQSEQFDSVFAGATTTVRRRTLRPAISRLSTFREALQTHFAFHSH